MLLISAFFKKTNQTIFGFTILCPKVECVCEGKGVLCEENKVLSKRRLVM